MFYRCIKTINKEKHELDKLPFTLPQQKAL